MVPAVRMKTVSLKRITSYGEYMLNLNKFF